MASIDRIEVGIGLETPIAESGAIVLGVASQAARRFRQPFIGSDHLLLGVTDPRVSTSKILKEQGVSQYAVQVHIERISGNGRFNFLEERGFKPEFSSRAQIALEIAAQLSERNGGIGIQDTDILLGLISDEGYGMGAHLIEDLGGDITAIRNRILSANSTERSSL